MSNVFVEPPANTGSGNKVDAEGLTIGGNSVKKQRVQAAQLEIVNATVTRPADSNIYTAGDVWTDSTSSPTKITFASVVRAYTESEGRRGRIIGALMIDSANQPTKLDCELWLFDTSFTPDNDNAVFTPTDAELATLIGIIPFNALVSVYVGDATSGGGGNAVYTALGLDIPFKCSASLTEIYGIVVVRNGYTPVSAEVLTFRLMIEQE